MRHAPASKRGVIRERAAGARFPRVDEGIRGHAFEVPRRTESHALRTGTANVVVAFAPAVGPLVYRIADHERVDLVAERLKEIVVHVRVGYKALRSDTRLPAGFDSAPTRRPRRTPVCSP